jgi:hypothetical protein
MSGGEAVEVVRGGTVYAYSIAHFAQACIMQLLRNATQ